jgi:hypothetical protein
MSIIIVAPQSIKLKKPNLYFFGAKNHTAVAPIAAMQVVISHIFSQ